MAFCLTLKKLQSYWCLNSRLAEIVNKINECFKPKQEVRKIFRRYSPQKKLLKTGVDNFGKNTRVTDEEYTALKTEAFVERVYVKEFNPASTTTDWRVLTRLWLEAY